MPLNEEADAGQAEQIIQHRPALLGPLYQRNDQHGHSEPSESAQPELLQAVLAYGVAQPDARQQKEDIHSEIAHAADAELQPVQQPERRTGAELALPEMEKDDAYCGKAHYLPAVFIYQRDRFSVIHKNSIGTILNRDDPEKL